MRKVAQISYINTRPFFYSWSDVQFPLLMGAPRELAMASRAGKIAAGPLPLVECWSMADNFEALGSWGISVKEESRSVFVLSSVPFSELNDCTIGLTHESSTSVALCEVLIKEKYGHNVTLQRGRKPSDQAQLVIGDEALRIWHSGPGNNWKHVTDLASEWWNWQKLPFVFAQWIVRKDLFPPHRKQLYQHIENSLSKGLKYMDHICQQESGPLGIPKEKLKEYLNGFTYELGAQEKAGIEKFYELYRGLSKPMVSGTK